MHCDEIVIRPRTAGFAVYLSCEYCGDDLVAESANNIGVQDVLIPEQILRALRYIGNHKKILRTWFLSFRMRVVVRGHEL